MWEAMSGGIVLISNDRAACYAMGAGKISLACSTSLTSSNGK